jgi:hypothetical protein
MRSLSSDPVQSLFRASDPHPQFSPAGFRNDIDQLFRTNNTLPWPQSGIVQEVEPKRNDLGRICVSI